jgi:hypothetical protein
LARVTTNTGRSASIALGLALSLVGGLSGCSILKAGPAPDAGFLPEPERMAEHRERAPFHKLWVEDGFREADYDSLFVAPVNTEHVLARSTWAEINVRISRSSAISLGSRTSSARP